MALDFSSAELPRLRPLERSFVENEVEEALKGLFLDLFRSHLAAKAFDGNVLGAAHLGSFELVRKAVNADGLALLKDHREEASTRDLYRAWKSADAQGRGLHFLRTYLQMLAPNAVSAYQLWQSKTKPYPSDLVAYPKEGYFPTSRIGIYVNLVVAAFSKLIDLQEINKLANFPETVMPARFVPIIKFMIGHNNELGVANAKQVTSVGRWSASGTAVQPAPANTAIGCADVAHTAAVGRWAGSPTAVQPPTSLTSLQGACVASSTTVIRVSMELQ